MNSASAARRRLQRLWALSRAERLDLLAGVLLLPPFWLGVRLLGLRTWRRLVGGRGQAQAAPADLAQARRLAGLVQIAAAHAWPRANCLSRSLVLEWLLRRRGVRAELRIGVRRAGPALEAHAWVECAGIPVNDDADIAQRFAPLPQLPPLRALPAR